MNFIMHCMYVQSIERCPGESRIFTPGIALMQIVWIMCATFTLTEIKLFTTIPTSNSNFWQKNNYFRNL